MANDEEGSHESVNGETFFCWSRRDIVKAKLGAEEENLTKCCSY